MANIMIVDDDPEIRELLAKVVKRDGHRALAASTVREAEALLGEKPDLFLLDIDMPGETGVELLFKLRRQKAFAHTPVVFITAYPDRTHAIQLTGQGAVHIFRKPFHLSDVRDLLQNMLGAAGEVEWSPVKRARSGAAAKRAKVS